MKNNFLRLHPAIRILFIALVYFVLAVVSLSVSYQSSNATPIWPPSGIALGILLLYGRRLWIGIFLGAFAANLYFFQQNATAFSLSAFPLSLLIAAGNTGEGIAAFMLIRKLHPKIKSSAIFTHVQTVFSFFAIVLFSSTISATIGTIAVFFSRVVNFSELIVVWLTWWTGDFSGIVLITPFILVWLGKKIEFDSSPARIYETAALVTMVLFVSGVVFLDWTHPHFIFTRAFIVVPFLIWIAVKLRQQMVTLISVLSATIAITGTLKGIGPFIASDLNDSLITVEVFVSINAIILLVLNAAILERKEKEKSLSIARDHLEQEVRNRTLELEEKNRELERRNQQLASFGYAASHDLQEPLRKIQTFSDQLLQHQNNFTENEKRIFQRIRSAAARMKQLIENLLSFSRVDSSNNLYEYTSLDSVANDVQHDLAEKIQETGAEIEVSPLPSVKVVSFQMHQLFTNLFSNAMKFRRNDVPLKITVSAELVSGTDIPASDSSPHQQFYHISFKDNGIGFDQQYALRIFDIFQRLHGQVEYEGTGIGLAICKKIVENHKGTIMATGEPNQGATFHIYLPFDPKEN